MTDRTIPESELRQVLEALEFFAPGDDAEAQAAIATLRKRLEEAPATEPQGEREAWQAYWNTLAVDGSESEGELSSAEHASWHGWSARASLSASTPSAVSAEAGGKYLTVVYRNIQPGDEARALIDHPKMSAASWSHALHDRDAAKAAAMAPPADKENGNG